MTRIHSTLIAFLIGAAATAGVYAAIHTVRLGQKVPVPSVSAHDLAARKAKLAAWSYSLAAARAKRPPALPKLPHFAPVPSQPAPAPTVSAAPAPPVTYVQPPPVVKYEHAPSPPATSSSSSSGDDSGDDSSSDDSAGGDGEGDG